MDIEILCNTEDAALFSNILTNCAKPLEWVKEIPQHDGHAVIVGGGPSAVDCLESIRWRQSLGQKVFALNNAAQMLEANGITVDYQVMVDARRHNLAFVGHSTQQLLASQVHPEVVDAAANPMLWHPIIEGIVDVIDSPREYSLIGGGTTVGLSALCLAFTLGYRLLHLYGYDSSHRAGMGHAYPQPQNDAEPVVKVTAYGKTWDCSLAMAYQAELFPECANKLIDLGCVITIDGDGLLPTAFRHLWAQDQQDPQPREVMGEPEKYRAMWAHPEYREVSPGEDCVETFLAVAKPHGRVIDFGCGTGRAALKIKEAGCDVLLVDFADNCRDPEAMHLPFLQKDLRYYFAVEEPILKPAPFGFCTDVMEHIEPGEVDDVIENLFSVAKSIFFQISLVPDAMGILIGQELHLSVHSMTWWRETFERLGFRVEWMQNRDHIAACFFVTSSKEV